MSEALLGSCSMAKKKAPKSMPVRLTEEAMKWAKIASGYTNESMAEYVSRIVAEKAREDADRLHAEAKGLPPSKPRTPHE